MLSVMLEVLRLCNGNLHASNSVTNESNNGEGQDFTTIFRPGQYVLH